MPTVLMYTVNAYLTLFLVFASIVMVLTVARAMYGECRRPGYTTDDSRLETASRTV